MLLFIIGLIILVVGGYLYGAFCEKVFGPDDRETPAVKLNDGVDFVVMKDWKNKLIELLNIAGTGPILGPIQGILFGPIAFLTIPIGCVLAGSLHDYFVGMISMRNGGAQVPKLVDKYMGSGMNKIYNVIIWILMLLTGVVFIYTPGDLIVNDMLGMDVNSNIIWVVYAIILLYYVVSTIFPIDQIIGRIYPVFGAILAASAVGIFIGIIRDGGASLYNITNTGLLFSTHPDGQRFIPVFFITVACGIMSGFHGSQATLISRTVQHEKQGRGVFYNMMIAEGFIAMVWAAGAMILFNRGTDITTGATAMVGIISRELMGTIGGFFAVAGVIVLPITSGDTAFRALRLMIAEQFHIDQKSASKRVGLSLVIFIPALLILFFAKSNANGFNLLWRYFGFTNQLVAVFALAMISVYLKTHGKNYWISLIPGLFYTFIVTSYIFHAPIGFGLESRLGLDPSSYVISYTLAAICVVLFYVLINNISKKRRNIIREADGI
ncbi:Carbon starvation protein CstA [Anaerosphaera aminiphila DSM 21120]|uniref:Carbon starvation protein CstA n=1 Tax=Anaerosphaera aminiphila DSM 21120 TaxID=1120995 RepID=A0A1M5U5P3_9FIRM|nr:carbon starvation CstA family protein [Anaerosphaera aminiphila]SHH58248.1 Carbon starvation protein CstA [Anaerosphaera aminiphila DSM 21120]